MLSLGCTARRLGPAAAVKEEAAWEVGAQAVGVMGWGEEGV